MIGRREEQELLKKLVASNEAEFIVVYGRRRVGKTYLVRTVFDNSFAFSYTGIAHVTAREQIAAFISTLKDYQWVPENEVTTWAAAFTELRRLLERQLSASPDAPILVFIDEMPWMDNKKSGFIPAFEHFWNSWAAWTKRVKLIVCGSATSWISHKIFRDTGGLYNRVTRQIALKPFTLAECKEFFESRGIVFNPHDIVESYMIFGGIPYYLKMLDGAYSLPINVDKLCFAENAPLKLEFNNLLDMLFGHARQHREVIETISKTLKGLTRKDIARQASFADGGALTQVLKELEECGFLRCYKPFGARKKNALYQLTDPFTLFHLRFISKVNAEDYWSNYTDNPGHRAWSGYAFEQVCLAHIRQIRAALSISGVLTDVSSWRSNGISGEKGAQIDLVIDRNDNVINLCEMKYSNNLVSVNMEMDEALRERRELFRGQTKTRKALHLTLVTTYGLQPNAYASTFQSTVTAAQLFQ